jgi:hypothetical protein
MTETNENKNIKHSCMKNVFLLVFLQCLSQTNIVLC